MRVVLPWGPSQSFLLIWGPFLSVPFLRFSNSSIVFSGVKSSQTHSPLTWIMGALEQAPRHSTSWMVNRQSGVVSPLLMPRCFSQVAMICSDPFSWHGVVPQIWRWNLPTRSRLNMVQKDATSKISISLTSVILATLRMAARERKLLFCFWARVRRGMMADRLQLGGNLARIFSTSLQFSAVKSKGVESLLSVVVLCEKYPAEKEKAVLCSICLLNFCNIQKQYITQPQPQRQLPPPCLLRQSQGMALRLQYLKRMSSNRIFSSVKSSESQGRNANLAGNMFKRAPIFNHATSDKQEPSSPFANYNCKSAESIFSSDSQQSIQEEKLTLDAVRQLMKQQFSRPKDDDGSKKMILTLQAQLKDIKQKLTESQSESNQKLQELRLAIKSEMKEEVAKMGREVDEEISNRLRTFFQKANVELKRDILKVASEEFLSFSYGEDLENRLECINETLDHVNGLIKTKQLSTQELQKKINSINVNETLESKLSKIEKEADALKKSMLEYHTRTKQLEEWRSIQASKSIEQSLNELRLKLEKIKEEQTFLQKPVKLFESKSSIYDTTLNKLQNKLDETQKNCEDVKGQLMELHKKIVSQQLFKGDSKTELKMLINDSDNFETSLILANNSSVFKMLDSDKKPSSEGGEISDFASLAASTSIEYADLKKSVYQVDHEGFLMDGEGKYLLTESGSMIRLENEQIRALFQSKLIEVIDT